MVSKHQAATIRAGIEAARNREFPFIKDVERHKLYPTRVQLFMKAWTRTNDKLPHPRYTGFCENIAQFHKNGDN